MIVPELWSDSKVAELAIKAGNEAVTAFIGIFSLADDEGCFEANPYNIIIKLPGISRQWNVELVTNWLQTMNEIGLIQLYSSDDGKQYLFLPSWFKNQTIPKPYPSSLPKPPKELVEKHQNYKDNLIKIYLKMKDRYETEYKKNKSNQCFHDFLPYEFKIGYELVTNWLNTSNDKKGKERKRKERKGNEEEIAASSESKTFKDVVKKFDENIHPITPIEAEKLKEWEKNLECEVIIKAIEEAVCNNGRTINYINAILNTWHSKGIKDINGVEAYLRDRQDKKRGDKDNASGNENNQGPNQYDEVKTLKLGKA